MGTASIMARRQLDDIVDAARLCLAHRRDVSTLVLIYSGIDAASALAAVNPAKEIGANFVRWVDTYLLPQKPLKATSLELFAARCGVVHTLTAHSKLSEQGKARRLLYGWTPGQADYFDRMSVAAGLTDYFAAVQVEDLIDGFAAGVAAFFDELERDRVLHARVEERGRSFYAGPLTPEEAATFAEFPVFGGSGPGNAGT